MATDTNADYTLTFNRPASASSARRSLRPYVLKTGHVIQYVAHLLTVHRNSIITRRRTDVLHHFSYYLSTSTHSLPTTHLPPQQSIIPVKFCPCSAFALPRDVIPHSETCSGGGGGVHYVFLCFHFNFMQKFRLQYQFEGNGLENNFGPSVKLSDNKNQNGRQNPRCLPISSFIPHNFCTIEHKS